MSVPIIIERYCSVAGAIRVLCTQFPCDVCETSSRIASVQDVGLVVVENVKV